MALGVPDADAVVDPTDVVLFDATLFNDPTSTETIFGGANRNLGWWVTGTSCCNSTLLAQYDLTNPGVGGNVNQSPNFFDQFENLVLAPGESFDFTFLRLIPNDGTADFGGYTFNTRLNLRFMTEPTALIERQADILPKIIVGRVTVPESTTLLMFILGLGVLIVTRLKQA